MNSLHSSQSSITSVDNIPLDPNKEIRLWDAANGRQKFDDMADLYAIIKTVEHLERAYVRDACTPDEFKTAEAALRAHGITDTKAFIAYYRMDCPRAVERLITHGVPATVLHSGRRNMSDQALVAQTTQHFITAMDSLRLNVRAIDETQPLIVDVVSSLSKVTIIPPDFEGLKKLQGWLVKLNAMRALDDLSEEQARQLGLDLDNAYHGFMNVLQHG